jgi:hypothetical protein
MEPIEIWPRGEIQFGAGEVAGDMIVMIELTDQSSGRVVRIGFQHFAFVALADHLKMVADEISAGRFPCDDA